jgi:amino acid transporter
LGPSGEADATGSIESTIAHSTELRRELGVADLVLAQILIIVGGSYVGIGGKLGPANLPYWLVAAALFFVPLVAVVLFLGRWEPLEGGLYQWAKLAFGPGVGFLVAFNLWGMGVVLNANIGLDCVQVLAYAFESLAWMRTSSVIAPVASVAILAALGLAALGGLRVGKRVNNAGGYLRIGTYALLLLLPIVALLTGRPLRAGAAHVEAPPFTLLGVGLLAKMGFGAFSGFEYVAIFAGEMRNPERSFARSVHLAAPLVVLMFVGGTSAVLAYVAPADIDLIAPIPQALGVAMAGSGLAARVVSVLVVLSVVSLLATASTNLAGITRLPMVAGWDGLLPVWFTRLSPRSRVPVNSIAFVTGVMIVLALAGLAGVEHQEAFQTINSAGLVLWALAYLVMFAIPIVGRAPRMSSPPMWLRITAGSGFAMTLLFVVLSVFPIVSVQSSVWFGVKVSAIVLVANAVGAGLYLAERRRRPQA